MFSTAQWVQVGGDQEEGRMDRQVSDRETPYPLGRSCFTWLVLGGLWSLMLTRIFVCCPGCGHLGEAEEERRYGTSEEKGGNVRI